MEILIIVLPAIAMAVFANRHGWRKSAFVYLIVALVFPLLLMAHSIGAPYLLGTGPIPPLNEALRASFNLFIFFQFLLGPPMLAGAVLGRLYAYFASRRAPTT